MDWKRLLNEPVRIAGLIRAIILAVAAFGYEMGPEKLGPLMLAVELVLMEISRALVTPNKLAEERQAAGQPVTETYKEDK